MSKLTDAELDKALMDVLVHHERRKRREYRDAIAAHIEAITAENAELQAELAKAQVKSEDRRVALVLTCENYAIPYGHVGYIKRALSDEPAEQEVKP